MRDDVQLLQILAKMVKKGPGLNVWSELEEYRQKQNNDTQMIQTLASLVMGLANMIGSMMRRPAQQILEEMASVAKNESGPGKGLWIPKR